MRIPGDPNTVTLRLAYSVLTLKVVECGGSGLVRREAPGEQGVLKRGCWKNP